MPLSASCAGIILSGGLNTRMGGRNKAFLDLDGRCFLDRIIASLEACFQEILIVTREPDLYAERPARVVADILAARSPLTGIHAGLTRMKGEFAFVTSCDTPLLTKEVIEVLVQAIAPDTDVITPTEGPYFQPMCAVYSRRCAPVIEKMLRRRELKVDQLYDQVRLKTIPYERFRAVDPMLESFFNVNTPEDLETARRMCARPAS
jgi:molybdopterin-guanine dinucleotide biosynthesis protein A